MAFPNNQISASDIRSQLYTVNNTSDGTAVNSAISWGDLYKDGTYLKDYGTGANTGLPTSGAISMSDLKGKYAVHTKSGGGANSETSSTSLHPSDIRSSHITRTVINGTYNAGLTASDSTGVKHVIDVSGTGQVDGVDQTGTGPANASGAAGGTGIVANNPTVISNNTVNSNRLRGGGGQGGYGEVYNAITQAAAAPAQNGGYNPGNAGTGGPGGSNTSFASHSRNAAQSVWGSSASFNQNYGQTNFGKSVCSTHWQNDGTCMVHSSMHAYARVHYNRSTGPTGSAGGPGNAGNRINPDFTYNPGVWNNPTAGPSGTPGGPGSAGGDGGSAVLGSVTTNPGANAGSNWNAGGGGNAGGAGGQCTVGHGSGHTGKSGNPNNVGNAGISGQYCNNTGHGAPHNHYNNGEMHAYLSITGPGVQFNGTNRWRIHFNRASGNPGSAGNAGNTHAGSNANNSGTLNSPSQQAAARPGGAAGSKYSGNVTLNTF